MASSSRSIAVAIIIGSVIIACGVYFGLRARPIEPNSTPPESANLDQVRAETTLALELQRPALTARCWRPRPSDGGDAPVRWTLNFNFDAQGQQITRGLVDDRKSARAEVTACLSRELAPLRISPPGAPAYVEVPFSIP